MAAINKTGVVRYNVSTDTHNSPWGHRNGVNGTTIHFDLGDNTLGCAVGEFDDPETMSVACMALRGNHDTAVWGWDKDSVDSSGKYRLQMQTYRDTANKIVFYGLDVGLKNVGTLQIPTRQIDDLAKALSELESGWDVVILTHAPLFPQNLAADKLQPGSEEWACGECWGRPGEGELNKDKEKKNTYAGQAEKLIDLLVAFKAHSTTKTFADYNGITYNFASNNGRVLGCFAGHIHNHVKCIYRGIAMEAFPTNGSDEWTDTDSYGNIGLYDPTLAYISINFDAGTVNGQSFTEGSESYNKMNKVGGYYHAPSDCYYINKVSGYFKLNAGSTVYPKFYDGVYLGYSDSTLDGTSFDKNGRHDRYWPLGTTVTLTIGSSNVSARVLWFDANGRLRYYSNDTDFNNNISGKQYFQRSKYTEIPNYRSVRVTFKANNVQWLFQNGLLVSVTPTYRSGTLKAKYNWGIVFNASGVPVGINENGGAAEDFGAGQNYVNVTNIKIYDGTTLKEITNMPQIGITDSFKDTSSSLKDDIKIDLARADYGGSNQISSPDNLLIRVVGDDGAVMWLYDGKLTSLTDQQVL